MININNNNNNNNNIYYYYYYYYYKAEIVFIYIACYVCAQVMMIIIRTTYIPVAAIKNGIIYQPDRTGRT